MKTVYKNRMVRAWKISREPSHLDWVQDNFAQKNFFFLKDLPDMFRAPSGNLNYGLGGGIYGKVGDILILNEAGVFTIMSEKKFRKHYHEIPE